MSLDEPSGGEIGQRLLREDGALAYEILTFVDLQSVLQWAGVKGVAKALLSPLPTRAKQRRALPGQAARCQAKCAQRPSWTRRGAPSAPAKKAAPGEESLQGAARRHG